jgi:hypothetical protein
MTTIKKKQGDTGVLDLQLGRNVRQADGSILFVVEPNLALATAIKFTLRAPDGLTIVINKRACTVLDAPTAKIRVAIGAGDYGNVGANAAEVEVTFNDGSVRTYPEDGYLTLLIQAQLA